MVRTGQRSSRKQPTLLESIASCPDRSSSGGWPKVWKSGQTPSEAARRSAVRSFDQFLCRASNRIGECVEIGNGIPVGVESPCDLAVIAEQGDTDILPRPKRDCRVLHLSLIHI